MKNRTQHGNRIGLLIAVLFAMSVLSGCKTSKYQPVDVERITAAAEREPAVPETAAEDEAAEAAVRDTMAAESETPGTGEDTETETAGSETPEAETSPAEEDRYEPADETVIVTADVLNIRTEADQNAPIYAQMKKGTYLHRTGTSDEWSRILYEGKTCYVATSMIEPRENPASEPGIAGIGLWGDPAGGASGTPFNGHTVAVDACYQAKENTEREPIGPSSDTMREKMDEGATGTVTGVKESELTLTIARKLKLELEDRGYEVVMTRESNDVNISNSERAEIANVSGAEIFIRLQANSMENSGVYGALTMCMTAQNPYNAGLHDKSYRLSKLIVDSICGETGTKNRGVQEVDNSGAINWSQIPVSDVAMGFLSNPDEDRWMQDDGYQEKIVTGIADAVDTYFATEN